MAAQSNSRPRGAGAGSAAARLPRVLLVDDSSVARAFIARALNGVAEIVGHAANGREGVAMLGRTDADIVLLDVEMPELNGLAALPLITGQSEAAVIVVSSTATAGAHATVEALRLGAADVLAKPSALVVGEIMRFEHALVATVRGLGAARTARAPGKPAKPRPSPSLRPAGGGRIACLAIGASTGGPQALDRLLLALPPGFSAPILVTQHLPPAFMAVFARHLATLGRPASVAEDLMPIRPGTVLVAPGDAHLTVQRHGARLIARLDSRPVANGCRPSVDPMLASLAEACGGGGMGILLSGMGRDGAEGAARLVEAGGTVMAQDEESSVVWGMPGAVAQAGLVSALLDPAALGGAIGGRG